MKKYLFLFVAMLCTSSMYAQGQAGKGQEYQSEKKYRIKVTRFDEAHRKSFNDDLNRSPKTQDRFFPLLVAAYKSAAISKAVNASSNIFSYSLSYLVGLTQQKQTFLKALNAQNTYKETLKTEVKIEDFYGKRSTKGALDPTDLQFNGFEFSSYIQVNKNGRDGGKPGIAEGNTQEHTLGVDKDKDTLGIVNAPGKSEVHNQNSSMETTQDDTLGHYAFHLVCKLDTGSLGMAHIANHSKFYLTVDTLILYPNYCDLPNDSTNKQREYPLSESFFKKRKDLNYEVKVKVYSSWINEAIMLNKDQLLGEFTIKALVNRENLIEQNGDSVFVYTASGTMGDKKLNTQRLVSIEGESFVVPRSYVGSSEEQVWGTGQYRLEFELSERCSINEDYYFYKTAGNGKEVNYANTPGDRKWKKDVWKTEWKEINSRKKGESFWKGAWKNIKTSLGFNGDWITEFVSPLSTVLFVKEEQALQNVLKFDEQEFTSALGGGQSSMLGGGQGEMVSGSSTPVQGTTTEAGSGQQVDGQGGGGQGAPGMQK